MNYYTYRLTLTYYRWSSCILIFFKALKKLKAVRRLEVFREKKKKKKKEKNKRKNNSDYVIILMMNIKSSKRLTLNLLIFKGTKSSYASV